MKSNIVRNIVGLVVVGLVVVSFLSCSENNKSKENTTNGVESQSQQRQWNVSIFLDLSDRIDPNIRSITPDVKQRDMAIISEIVEVFRADMKLRNAHKAKGRLKVFFDPIPVDHTINQLAGTLQVDLSTMDNSQKKDVYDHIQERFTSSLEDIYNKSIETKNWIGADIWGFFKRKVKDHCLQDGYRNILVILTDGYIYHERSKEKQGQRYSYLLPSVFSAHNLRNNADWRSEIERLDFGLIAPASDLSELEVLILEISPAESHSEDEELLEYTIGKWLQEMGVQKFAIHGTDLPINTAHNIKRFFKG